LSTPGHHLVRFGRTPDRSTPISCRLWLLRGRVGAAGADLPPHALGVLGGERPSELPIPTNQFLIVGAAPISSWCLTHLRYATGVRPNVAAALGIFRLGYLSAPARFHSASAFTMRANTHGQFAKPQRGSALLPYPPSDPWYRPAIGSTLFHSGVAPGMALQTISSNWVRSSSSTAAASRPSRNRLAICSPSAR
jgi:hypothetical protein